MSCSHLPIETTVHQPVATAVPGELTQPCASDPSDGTVGGELMRLDTLVRCERDGKTAIRTWSDNLGK